MNSCQQEQWKKITGLFHYAASLRLVARSKTLQANSSWDLESLTIGKLVNFNGKKKEYWLDKGDSAVFLIKYQEVLMYMGKSTPLSTGRTKPP